VNKLEPNTRLEIIGKGDYRPELEKLALELNISDIVTFHGFVDNHTKNQLLAKSHIVVNTSLIEGWGITNIEATACGQRVLSESVTGLKNSVKNNVSGMLYEY